MNEPAALPTPKPNAVPTTVDNALLNFLMTATTLSIVLQALPHVKRNTWKRQVVPLEWLVSLSPPVPNMAPMLLYSVMPPLDIAGVLLQMAKKSLTLESEPPSDPTAQDANNKLMKPHIPCALELSFLSVMMMEVTSVCSAGDLQDTVGVCLRTELNCQGLELEDNLTVTSMMVLLVLSAWVPPVTMESNGSYAKMCVRRPPVLKTLMPSVCLPWEAVEKMLVNPSSMTAWENKYSV